VPGQRVTVVEVLVQGGAFRDRRTGVVDLGRGVPEYVPLKGSGYSVLGRLEMSHARVLNQVRHLQAYGRGTGAGQGYTCHPVPVQRSDLVTAALVSRAVFVVVVPAFPLGQAGPGIGGNYIQGQQH
jgi:hypothetical protein